MAKLSDRTLGWFRLLEGDSWCKILVQVVEWGWVRGHFRIGLGGGAILGRGGRPLRDVAFNVEELVLIIF